jgi:hypothetical protein
MRIRLALGFLFLTAGLASAEEQVLKGVEILEVLGDKTLTADGDIQQLFQEGGLTLYMEKGSSSQGRWKVEKDEYCSQWPPNQGWSCYQVTQDGEMITFIAKDGTRFPMRGR